MPDAPSTADAQTIADNLESVRSRIVQACQRVGRDPDDVTLVAVSKTFSLEMIEAARQQGVIHFGENKAQELSAKAEKLPGVYLGGEVQWHMIGHLQRNKAKDIVETTDLFHALDSPRLAKELNKRARREERVIECFVQANVSGEESKYGLDPDDVHDLLDRIEEYPHLKVTGLMTLASYVEDPEQVRDQFVLLRRLSEEYNDKQNPRVNLQYLSMGMSNDFEVAIEEGATHIRVGSAIFGERTYT